MLEQRVNEPETCENSLGKWVWAGSKATDCIPNTSKSRSFVTRTRESITAIIFGRKATKNGLVECSNDSMARYFMERDEAFSDILSGLGRHRSTFIL